VLAQIAAERLGHSTASTLYLNNAYGNGLSQGFVNSFEEEYGGTVNAAVSFSEGRSSYTSQLNEALSDDPDVLLVVGSIAGLTVYVTLLVALDIESRDYRLFAALFEQYRPGGTVKISRRSD